MVIEEGEDTKILCINSVDLFILVLILSGLEEVAIKSINVVSAEKDNNCSGSHFKISSFIILISFFISKSLVGYRLFNCTL